MKREVRGMIAARKADDGAWHLESVHHIKALSPASYRANKAVWERVHSIMHDLINAKASAFRAGYEAAILAQGTVAGRSWAHYQATLLDWPGDELTEHE